MTGNVHNNCYSHVRLLPTHSHLASADFIRLLPVVTSADPHIRLLPIAFPFFANSAPLPHFSRYAVVPISWYFYVVICAII